jgi:ribosomal protein L40E
MPFIVKNNGFICEKCRTKNPPAPKTCRNHCIKCLYSKHVDDKFPGDRKSNCQGLMKPIGTEGDIDHLQIIHQCEKCDKVIKNKIAADDEMERVVGL